MAQSVRRAFYLALHEKDGAIWAANDHKELWCDMAEDYERRLSSVTSTQAPAQCAPDPKFRSQVFHAAERSNKKFGQWMPQQWLEIFIGEMMVDSALTSTDGGGA